MTASLYRSLTPDEFCALGFYKNVLRDHQNDSGVILLNHDLYTSQHFRAYCNENYSHVPSHERKELPKLVYSLWKKSHDVLSKVEQKLSIRAKFKGRKTRTPALFITPAQAQQLLNAYHYN